MAPKPGKQTNLYRIKPVSGKGITVFARGAISKGARIFAEAPIIKTERKDISPFEICSAYYELDKRLKPEYYTLTDHGDLLDEGLPAMMFSVATKEMWDDVRTGKETRREMCAWYMTKCPEWKGAAPEKVEEEVTVVSIFLHNRFPIRNYEDTEDGWGVFTIAGRINRSCIPNCYVSWNTQVDMLCAHALRDIQAGEELCIAYRGLLSKGRTTRQRILKQLWGFDRKCPSCDLDTEYGNHGQARRDRIEELRNQLGSGDMIETDPDGSIMGEMLRLMDEEGIVDWIDKGEVYVFL